MNEIDHIDLASSPCSDTPDLRSANTPRIECFLICESYPTSNDV